jgi:heterodisulfide reductase subunit B2
MDRLFQVMGADVITDWDAKTDCCGGMMMLTKRDGALRLCHELLVAARQYKADVVVAACPLCEMNLEGYQRQVNQAFGTDFDIPVMYFTQLAGLALGADPKQLAIDKQVVSCEPVLAAIPA